MFSLPALRAVMTIAAMFLLGVASARNGKAEEQKPEIDPAADKRMQAMSEYFGKLESFSVEAVHTMEMQQEGEETQSYSDHRRIVIEQPNRLVVTALEDGEGKVVSDGKQLFAYWPSAERYLLGDAPGTIDEVLQEEASLLLGAGRTVVQLAAGDSYDQFMASVTKVTLLEPEQVGNVDCDRIEMSQENAKILLWIEQGEHPLLRKMRWEMQLDMPEVDVEMPSQIVTYSNWEIEKPIAGETFAIEVPEDAEQVDTLRMQDHVVEGPHPLVGAEAPDCELSLLDGGREKLAELEGKKVVVLDFWALWCAPCLEALPSIDRVATKFADRDVAFFAVNLGDKPEDIHAFLEEHELNLPIPVDPNSHLSELFQANSIPMTVIVDKQGVVQVVHVGFAGSLEQTLSEEIEAVLEGKQLAKETLQAAREAKRWGEPIPAGKDAVTAKDAIEYAISFNLRTSVEAYEEFGSRDDAWDDATIEFLTAIARHFSSAKGCKSRMELIEMAEPLVESGCDDPLVQYCHGAMLEDGQQNRVSKARGSRFVERSYSSLVDTGYPANRCFAAAKRIWNSVKNDKDQVDKAEKYLALTQEHALETILQDDLDSNDGRTIYDHLNAFAESLPLETRREFCEAAKAHEEKSPYVVNMLVGEYHLDAAWKSRGGDFASEVTEEGWKGFGEHMELAREAFEKAWEAAPHRPEAATAMVKVSMGSSRSPLREMRRWFDRVVRAQFDYRTAYSHLIFGLMPRWHGSHDRMYQFGVECMETERYDTDVPYELCDALWRIMQDEQNPLGNRYVQRPGIYDNVRIVCQRYIEQEDGEANIPWWKTVWLCFAYLSEQWDDAIRLLEELSSDLNADALGRFPLGSDEVISAVRIHSSPHADAIMEAFRDADHGRHQQAVTALSKLLKKEDLQPLVASQVESRLQGLNWSIDFQEGARINLVPEKDLDGWRIAGGNWIQTPDGGMRGVSNSAGVILECETEFGTHWQISGEVVHGKSPYNPWNAGILLNIDGRPRFSMMFNPTEKWVAAGPHKRLKEHRQPFNPNGKTTKFVIRVAGDTVNIWLNEDLVVEDQEIEGLSDATSSRVAIGAKYTWDGSTLTYRNLEIEPVEPAK